MQNVQSTSATAESVLNEQQGGTLVFVGKILVSLRAFIALFLLLGFFAAINDSFLASGN